jgi:hypothetical protein
MRLMPSKAWHESTFLQSLCYSGAMLRLYRIFRDVLTWAVLAIIAALLGEFAIEFGREHKWFERPTERLEAVLGFLGIIQSYPWFWPIFGGLVGLVGGMWLDAVIRRRAAVPPVASVIAKKILITDEGNGRLVLTAATAHQLRSLKVFAEVSSRAFDGGHWTPREMYQIFAAEDLQNEGPINVALTYITHRPAMFRWGFDSKGVSFGYSRVRISFVDSLERRQPFYFMLINTSAPPEIRYFVLQGDDVDFVRKWEEGS